MIHQIRRLLRHFQERLFALRKGAFLLFLPGMILGLSSGQCPSTGSERAAILWDTWGIPHVFAQDDVNLFHAFGWAQAQSHGDLILRLYGQARGRGAEYWGERYLESDKWVRLNGIPQRSLQWYERQEPAFRRALDAFVDGFNAYAREHADQIDDQVEVILPVQSTDVLAHVQRVIHFHFVANPGVVKGMSERWRTSGSNAWAVAPSRAAGGHAMLLANPHLPWSDFWLFYEAHLVTRDVDVYGVTLVGAPGLAIAFNDHLGWTHTVNTHDGQDLYELTLVEDGYRWDNGSRPFETETHTLKVKRDDRTVREETLIVRRSIHGPIVAEKAGKAVALRVVGLDEPEMFRQWWDMARARNLVEFESALKRLQIPMFTVMYADHDGHIMHLFGGRTPVRPKGDWNWASIVPGETSATLWTRTHPYEDLPRVVDPASGWLQNANDPPWTTTFPAALDTQRFPAYMAPRFMHFRAQRSARMLNEDDRISLDELIAYKHSTRMELADRILDDLIPAARESDNHIAREAADVLNAWDRQADAESRGAVLFQSWYQEMSRRAGSSSPFAIKWDEGSPLTTPDGLADPGMAVKALEAAAEKVQRTHGGLDVPWGEVNRLRRDGVDLPANGGPGSLGIFRVTGFEPSGQGQFTASGGDSYVAAIEFSDPVRAMALLSYGNASQPRSPHRLDQLPLYARKQLRPVWRTRKDIEAHLESRRIFR